MDRRNFLKALSAPFVITSAGVLMPVVKIFTPRGRTTLEIIEEAMRQLQDNALMPSHIFVPQKYQEQARRIIENGFVLHYYPKEIHP